MPSARMSRRAFVSQSSAAAVGLAAGWGTTMAETRGRRPARGPEPSAGFVCGDIYLEHVLSQYHPESPERIDTILTYMSRSGLDTRVTHLTDTVDPEPHIRRVHSDEHLSSIRSCDPAGRVAEHAVSGVLGAVQAVHAGKVRTAFCAVRPPGHHAHDNGANKDGLCQGQGFCFYNNVAIAAAYARHVLGYERILICDWDYHYGNGTAWAFDDDPSVFFFSTHNWRTYPGTGNPDYRGSGDGAGYTLNVHLPPGSGDDEAYAAWESRLMPELERLAFKPEFVLISAGFDSRIDDRLGTLRITDKGFATLTRKAMAIADEHCNGRIVSCLEGGYNVDGNARASLAHLATLAGLDWRDYKPLNAVPKRRRGTDGEAPAMREGMLHVPRSWGGTLTRVAVLDDTGAVLYVVPGRDLGMEIIDLWPGHLASAATVVSIRRATGAEFVLPYVG